MKQQHSKALEEALTWIDNNFETIGVIVSGSIIRGNPDDNSDFDIYVIHKELFRQRIQKYFNGVPCEIFVNNLDHVYQYFESELKNNRPVTADIISTGKVISGSENSQFQKMLDKSKDYCNRSPKPTEQQHLLSKHGISSLYEDATDLLATDPVTATYFLDRMILESIDYMFFKNENPLPRAKERIHELQIIEPNLGELVTEYYKSNKLEEKYKIAGRIVHKLVGEKGFFEWNSSPEV